MQKSQTLPTLAAAVAQAISGIAAPSLSPGLTAPLPAALATLAAGRDHILTEEFAKVTSRASQTIRKNYCRTGECFGIRPVKVGARLLWPIFSVAALLSGDTSRRTKP